LRAASSRSSIDATTDADKALEVTARTDLVAFVPSRLIAAAGADLGLRRLDPPLDTGHDEQDLLHPARLHTDPASIWLRRLVLEIGRRQA
jgi:hypothetical protein